MIASVLLTTVELLRIVLKITYPIANFFFDSLYFIFNGATKPLPAIDNKILLMPVTELAEKIRKRQLKCKDVMRAYVKRSQLVNPYINAVTDSRYVDALQDAIAVDRFLESGEKTEDQIADETPLLGVPFTCKEVLGIKGFAANFRIGDSQESCRRRRR
ncbi:fatty-acid amide hydrolase 2 [Trichonephila inaurata madagascariensis]|uniref:Fatty-acid amide hydrolase 2 n=1 Tax=Trichonephila inaurata madagascariensis TaxID=2747483 RepID=A0A8X7CBM2_9ARAC|nr:fatty-acid amide hydrolase 2 [Trichonephila inaurata madagascariensis]